MTLETNLKEIGLNSSEIKVYMFLLQKGPSIVQNVSRETFITRSNCYYVLRSLINRGLVKKLVLNNKTGFEALDPAALEKMIERQSDIAVSITPLLRQLSTVSSVPVKTVMHRGKTEVDNFLSLLPVGHDLIIIGPIPAADHPIHAIYTVLTKPEISGREARFIEMSDLLQHFIVYNDILAILKLQPDINLVEIQSSEVGVLVRGLINKNVSRETFSALT